mmetsp:Transcript_13658/g.25855  ORF Transcript_13658/g.25855 Transcript_13658/m.25855 type:complete len:222 (-) Transcript_13658:1676-2341(-)
MPRRIFRPSVNADHDLTGRAMPDKSSSASAMSSLPCPSSIASTLMVLSPTAVQCERFKDFKGPTQEPQAIWLPFRMVVRKLATAKSDNRLLCDRLMWMTGPLQSSCAAVLRFGAVSASATASRSLSPSNKAWTSSFEPGAARNFTNRGLIFSCRHPRRYPISREQDRCRGDNVSRSPSVSVESQDSGGKHALFGKLGCDADFTKAAVVCCFGPPSTPRSCK